MCRHKRVEKTGTLFEDENGRQGGTLIWLGDRFIGVENIPNRIIMAPSMCGAETHLTFEAAISPRAIIATERPDGRGIEIAGVDHPRLRNRAEANMWARFHLPITCAECGALVKR
jgi:hypothetical protein